MLKIQVVGSGCPSCQKLEAVCREIVTENQMEAEIEKITDFHQFADLGILLTPGLLINGKVASMGKIPVKATIKSWLDAANQ